MSCMQHLYTTQLTNNTPGASGVRRQIDSWKMCAVLPTSRCRRVESGKWRQWPSVKQWLSALADFLKLLLQDVIHFLHWFFFLHHQQPGRSETRAGLLDGGWSLHRSFVLLGTHRPKYRIEPYGPLALSDPHGFNTPWNNALRLLTCCYQPFHWNGTRKVFNTFVSDNFT